MTIGEKIQFYRKKKGMSQEELGQSLHLSRQTVSLWENGQTLPTIDNLIRLKEIFGVTIDEMVSDTETTCEEYAVTLDKKTLDSIWKRKRRSYLFSLLPSLLWWIIAIPVFIIIDAPSLLVGILAGALFTDLVFCTKQLFEKILKEKRSIYSVCEKTAKLKVYEASVTLSISLEGEPLQSIMVFSLKQSFENAVNEFSAVREPLVRKAVLENPDLLKEVFK